jgi:outer membrane lipoprotein-sorting protein
MRSILPSLLFFHFLIANLSGQQDPDALKILDQFSETAQKAPSVSMKFSLITNNQMEKTTDTLQGNIILSKDKYRLELPDNTIWFNGTTSWSYLPAEKEVTITRPDKKDNSFQSRPSAIFSIYKNGYKTRLIEETSKSYLIDLYPEDIKSDLIRIRLTIGKPLTNLIRLEYKKKDGVIITLLVKDYNLQNKPAQDEFTFQPSKFKDVEINDIR